MKTIGVLVPEGRKIFPRPSSRPIGISTKLLYNKKIQTVFGSVLTSKNNNTWMSGHYADLIADQWVTIDTPIDALHDRYPSQIRASSYALALQQLQSIPMGNPYELTMLCRDKVQTQYLLESEGIPMPALCTDYQYFNDLLQKWNTGFIKPQFGALGQNVRCVHSLNHLDEYLEGVVPEQLERSILQQAIIPPKNWAGLSVRHLIQRDIDGSWLARPAVLRRSINDPVVNVARGAEAVLANKNLPTDTIVEIRRISQKVAQILQNYPNGQHALEFGIDYVIDQTYKPWLIEVNSRPRGRLEVLAAQYPKQFTALHQQACIQPILYLAACS